MDKEKCINGCTIKTRSGITWLKAVSWQLRGTGRKIRERLSHAFWGMEDVIYIYIYIYIYIIKSSRNEKVDRKRCMW